MAIVADVQTGDILAMATVDGADRRPSPRTPAPATRAEPPAHRRLRAGLDQQGHHDGGRARGRASSTPRHRVRPSRRAITSATRRTTTSTTHPIDDDGRRHPRAVVERRDDQDRAGARQGRASTTTSARSASASTTALDFPARADGHPARRSTSYNDTSMGVDADRQRHRGHRRCRCSTCTRRSPTTAWPAPPRLVDGDDRRRRRAPRRAAPARRTRWCRRRPRER